MAKGKGQKAKVHRQEIFGSVMAFTSRSTARTIGMQGWLLLLLPFSLEVLAIRRVYGL
jgi:hypothetical protein